MDNSVPDWLVDFSHGFRSAGDVRNFLLGILIALIAAGVIWFLVDRYQKYLKEHPVQTRLVSPIRLPKQTLARIIPIPGWINPLQQKIIYDLIDEFRKQEPSAQAVPSSALEKYSEFFFS